MADLSVQAILSANTSGFQRGFQNAARTARTFSQDMRTVQSQVNRLDFNKVDRGFGVFRQLQKQFDAGPAKQFFNALDDFGDLFFFGGAITGAIAGVGSLVDLFVRGEDATFGFAGAINALRKGLGDIQPDLVKLIQFRQEFFGDVGKQLGSGSAPVIASMKDWVKEFLKTPGDRRRDTVKGAMEGLLPDSTQSALSQAREVAREGIKSAEQVLRSLQGPEGTLKTFDLQTKFMAGGMSFEDANKQAKAAIAEAKSLAEGSVKFARNQLVLLDADAEKLIFRRQTENAERILGTGGFRGFAGRLAGGVGESFMGGFRGVMGQLTDFRQPVNTFMMEGKKAFDFLADAARKFQADVNSLAEAAKRSAKGPLGEYKDTVAALNEAFKQRRITKEQLGFGLLDAQGKLRNAIGFDELRDPKLLLKGTTAAFEEAERIRQADKNHDEVIEVAEAQLAQLKIMAEAARRQAEQIVIPAQF